MSDIRLQGVSKRYGEVAAADNVDLAVAQGEFVTILGRSGSGKTTLLSLIAGLNQPTSGRIFIAGRDVTEAPAAAGCGLIGRTTAYYLLEDLLPADPAGAGGRDIAGIHSVPGLLRHAGHPGWWSRADVSPTCSTR